METIDKLRGLRTCLKMCFNVLERLETKGSDDWQVGVKCQSDEKADYVHKILVSVLSALAEDFGFEIVKTENVIEVRKELTRLRVLPPVKEESDNAKHPEQPLPDSPVSDSSSSGNAEDKEFKQIDDVISAFQAHFS
jgi:hypothetical protein